MPNLEKVVRSLISEQKTLQSKLSQVRSRHLGSTWDEPQWPKRWRSTEAHPLDRSTAADRGGAEGSVG